MRKKMIFRGFKHLIAYLFLWKGSGHFVDQVAEEEKKDSGGESGQNNEAESQICSQICDPDWEKWVAKLKQSK